MVRHHHPEKHRFSMLGRLVGSLLLCCTSKNEGTRHEAAEAVRHLYIFIGQQRSERSRVGLGPSRHGHAGTARPAPGRLRLSPQQERPDRASPAAFPRADEPFPLP